MSGGQRHTADFAESGPIMLASLLGLYQIPVQPAQLRHQVGHDRPFTSEDVVRLARQNRGVRCRALSARTGELSEFPLPALGDGPDGWFLIGRSGEAGVIIQRPGCQAELCRWDRLETIWSGALVLLTTRHAPNAATSRFDASWFIPQLVRYRHLIGEVLLITLALNLLGLAAPLFFQNVIDKVVVYNSGSTLTVLVIGFVAASIWEVALGWLRTRLYSETSQKIDVELGARLFSHLMRLPLAYFESRRVGDTVARVRSIETIREFMTSASLSVLVDPLFALIFVSAMWFYAPRLLLVVLATLPLYVAVSMLATGPLRRLLAEKFERGAASNAFLIESISTVETIKSAAIEPLWQQQWEQQLAGYSGANQRVIGLANTSTQLIQLISKLGMAALLYFGAREVIAGRLSVGALVAFNMLAQRVAQPVLRLAQLWQDCQQTRLSIHRLGDVMNYPAEPTGQSSSTPTSIRGDIRFEQVRFRYGTERGWALDNLTFHIPAGEMIGIAGTSGSGKSTILRLLQRLHLPNSGRILLDGNDLAQVDPGWLRRQIGVVLQESCLYNRSIRANIALARPSASFDEIVRASRLAGAEEFILRLPQGYDTIVEESGANLSGGQRQRLAIARALLTQPRILVLDEATSALDAESEEIVRRNLRAIAHGRTVIIVAHRLSALRDCHRIITLEAGRIVECGSHTELVRAGGRYADLYRRQMSAIETAA